MKIMPGFLAEESLYREGNIYLINDPVKNSDESSSVLPQLPNDIFQCMKECEKWNDYDAFNCFLLCSGLV